MDSSPIHQGYLKKYGGFLLKHWKERYLLLTQDGRLFLSRDLESAPDLEIDLLSRCQAVLEGSALADVPKLPAGTRRDCCLGLQLNEGRKLLLLAPDAQECSKWINILQKVKEGLSLPPLSPASCRLHSNSPIRRCCWRDAGPQSKEKTQGKEGRMLQCKESCPPRCLRHGPQTPWGVKTACVLMGEAAAGPTLAYMVTAGQEMAFQPPPDAGCQYDTDFEGLDPDCSAFDFGGFAF